MNDCQTNLNSELNFSEPSSKTVDGASKRKYLVFKLGEERFAIPLSSVKEVIGLTSITEIPQVPRFFKGLINLRGKIISVIDLRLKIGLTSSEYCSKKTSIVITEIDEITLGVIVDDVQEVASYEMGKEIEENIDVHGKISRDYIQGVAKTENRLVLLMNPTSILSSNEMAIIKRQAA